MDKKTIDNHIIIFDLADEKDANMHMAFSENFTETLHDNPVIKYMTFEQNNVEHMTQDYIKGYADIMFDKTVYGNLFEDAGKDMHQKEFSSINSELEENAKNIERSKAKNFYNPLSRVHKGSTFPALTVAVFESIGILGAAFFLEKAPISSALMIGVPAALMESYRRFLLNTEKTKADEYLTPKLRYENFLDNLDRATLEPEFYANARAHVFLANDELSMSKSRYLASGIDYSKLNGMLLRAYGIPEDTSMVSLR